MAGPGLGPCPKAGTVTSNAEPPASAGKVFQLLVLCSHLSVYCFNLPSLLYPSQFTPFTYSSNLPSYILRTFCVAKNVYYCSLLVACCIICQHCTGSTAVRSERLKINIFNRLQQPIHSN